MGETCPICHGKGYFMDPDWDGDWEWGAPDSTCDCPAGREKFPVVVSPHVIDVYEQDFIPDPEGVRNARNMFDSIRVERMDKANQN